MLALPPLLSDAFDMPHRHLCRSSNALIRRSSSPVSNIRHGPHEEVRGNKLVTLRFTRLDRPSIRRLKSGEKITEHGITAERM